MSHRSSRRSFVLQGCAAATLGALPYTVATAATGRVRIRHPNTPAGAAGALWVGGDLQIDRMGFGTTDFVSNTGVVKEDPAQIRALLRRAIDLGINHLDCADVYGSGLVDGLCERFIYDALYPYPPDLIIATKGGQLRGSLGGGEVKAVDGRPEHLRSACESSLKRLKLEQIPLYYMHQPDPAVPYEDSIGELGKLQKEGKIRHIGVSNVTAEQLAGARALVTVDAVQNRYNILSTQGQDILADCERHRTAFIPFSLLGGRAAPIVGQQTENSRLDALKSLANERRISLTQAQLAWLLASSPVMVTIPGTTKIEHLEENVAAAKVRFTKREMERVAQGVRR